jgi:hypothetical protein
MVGMILRIVALHDSEQEAPMRQKGFFCLKYMEHLLFIFLWGFFIEFLG